MDRWMGLNGWNQMDGCSVTWREGQMDGQVDGLDWGIEGEMERWMVEGMDQQIDQWSNE